jgi:UDP-2-acetamido-2,6-beta-L-arabino-hexul-4-ose reductase
LDIAPLGRPWQMSEILSELQAFHESYIGQQIVPDLRDNDRLRLFNTYRAHLLDDCFPIAPLVHADHRGNLFELAKELNGGQSFISTTLPSITRGNHFHFHKVERFCVLRGEAKISMRNMATGDCRVFNVSGERPCFIDIPTLWAHNITNTGDSELLTFFWANEIFDRSAADTYPVAV